MPDPETELKRMVEELHSISAVLDATETPALVRPDVPYKQVTEELMHWTIRVYAYSILSQFREMLRSALHLYDADHVPAVFLCALQCGKWLRTPTTSRSIASNTWTRMIGRQRGTSCWA